MIRTPSEIREAETYARQQREAIAHLLVKADAKVEPTSEVKNAPRQ